MKSYGRAPTFLLLTGYEQVRSVICALTGDLEGARDVQLVLPETRVCSTARGLAEARPGRARRATARHAGERRRVLFHGSAEQLLCPGGKGDVLRRRHLRRVRLPVGADMPVIMIIDPAADDSHSATAEMRWALA